MLAGMIRFDLDAKMARLTLSAVVLGGFGDRLLPQSAKPPRSG